MKRRDKSNDLPLSRRLEPRRHSSPKKVSFKYAQIGQEVSLIGRALQLVHILFCTAVLVALWKIVTWSESLSLDSKIENTIVQQEVDLGRKGVSSVPASEPLSEIITHVGSSGTGLMNKYFYRFKNVQIAQGRIKFYYDQNTFTPPTEDHWVDIVSCNATSPKYPTMLVVKGDAQPIRWHYIPIDYIAVGNDVNQHKLKCQKRISRATYLLQVRYSYNIWHTWNEGIMGLFQTLRELGKLPLALVGENGDMTELLDGMGSKPGECPWIYDHKRNTSARMERCDIIDWKEHSKCDMSKDRWCRPGAVFSMARVLSEHSPLILTFTPESTKNVWSHLYDSISLQQENLESLMGSCFSDIIIGKTSTLNFYQTLNSTPPAPEVLAKVPRIDNVEARVEAMAVFKAFILSSQREWVIKEQERTGVVWDGYEDEGLEILRKGVGPEALNTDALEAITPKIVAGVVREEMEELKKSFEKHQSIVNPIVKEFEHRYGFHVPEKISNQEVTQLFDEESKAALAYQTLKSKFKDESFAKSAFEQNHLNKGRAMQGVESSNGWFVKSTNHQHESPLPVVTYMSRNFFARGVVNERDILEYILSRYTVTVRVTTFQEPLLEVMELLAHSDVLFGMHGAGWTNALFMKRGATTMQMYPYGWKLPDNSTVRGYNYREIIYASEGKYFEWINPIRENAYFRRIDFKKQKDSQFQLHPGIHDPLPQDKWPGNQWIYQNTYVDMKIFGKEIDKMMQMAGILPNTR